MRGHGKSRWTFTAHFIIDSYQVCPTWFSLFLCLLCLSFPCLQYILNVFLVDLSQGLRWGWAGGPWILLMTLLKDGADICFFSSPLEPVKSQPPFRDYWEWPCRGISLFPQHSWVDPIRSQGFVYIYFSSIKCSLTWSPSTESKISLLQT